ncbi:MDR family MFS transporter [Brevibacillus sp. H7]|uniref:MDR family MFS transporter n=1 Tax=Brevibacillus sp. H7 TaxID=3349138 RepID=UPI0038175D77
MLKTSVIHRKWLPPFHPVSWGVIMGTLLSRTGFFMTIPFLGIYLGEVKGLDPTTIGAILGVSFLVGTFSSFFGGALSDRIGRYPVMIFSIFLWSLVFLAFTLADSAWSFLILNAVNGFCRNVFEPTARALLTDVTREEERVSVFNARYFAINIGGAAGPLLGLQLGSSVSELPFHICASIYALYGVAIIALMLRYGRNSRAGSKTSVDLKSSMKVIFSDKVFRYFLIGNLFVMAGFSHLETTLSQYLGGNRIGTYSYLFFINAASVLLLQYPIIALAKRVTALTALKIGSILFGLGLFGFGYFTELPGLIVSMVIFTIGEILCMVIGDVVIGEIAPEQLRGTYYGASGFSFLGQSFGAWIGGYLLSSFGLGQGPLIFGILMCLTFFAYPFFQLGQSSHNRQNTTLAG